MDECDGEMIDGRWYRCINPDCEVCEQYKEPE